MHIESGPGVTGLSGMQVQPFFPSRSVVVLPLSSIVTIAASCAIEAGAAASAPAIGSFDAAGAPALASTVVFSAIVVFCVVVAVLLHPASATIAAPISSGLK
jgi:hypothetical protein